MMTDGLTRIWEPLDIGPTRVKHRIMTTPHGQLYGRDNVPSDRHVAYYRERAKGGAALVGIEQTAGHRHSKGALAKGLTAWERRSIPHFEKLAAAIHEYDCRVFVELAGVGVNDRGRTYIDDWHPVWGPSRVRSPVMHELPAVLEHSMMREIAADFGQSALNLLVAGVDGVEMHAAHGYLFMQFLSPAFNKRTDAYGGSARNRCRFILDVLAAMRERVGSELTIGIRISYDEYLGQAGLTPDLADEYVDIISESGLVDFLDISCGGYHTLHYGVVPMGTMEEGFLLPYAKRAKDIAGDRAKVFAVGRIKSLALAEKAIEMGAADMVAMLRAHIADPQLVRKAREGRSAEITHCIGANECISAVTSNQELTCTVNPAAGREAYSGEGTLKPAQTQARGRGRGRSIGHAARGHSGAPRPSGPDLRPGVRRRRPPAPAESVAHPRRLGAGDRGPGSGDGAGRRRGSSGSRGDAVGSARAEL